MAEMARGRIEAKHHILPKTTTTTTHQKQKQKHNSKQEGGKSSNWLSGLQQVLEGTDREYLINMLH